MSVFSADEKVRIEAAIRDVEQRTAGELVVAAVRRSAHYGFERLLGSVFWSLGLSLAIYVFYPALPVWGLLSVQIASCVAFWFVFGQAPLLRAVLPKEKTASLVRARAFRLFAERGVYLTRDRSGLLIMVSELEHQVVILGDEGIHRHVGTDGWQNHVDEIITGIKEGRAGEAVEQVLSVLGDVLAQHFPRREDDTNELSDVVIEESS